MTMANTRNKMQVTFLVRPKVWAHFKGICQVADVSISYGLERALIDVINAGRIPGIEPLEIERHLVTPEEERNQEKYGPVPQLSIEPKAETK